MEYIIKESYKLSPEFAKLLFCFKEFKNIFIWQYH